ncbi:MAG: glycosyltransferase [Pseudomonadota bacterium]|nr:glycosyltransferase [Pseudomonadota bacterium]
MTVLGLLSLGVWAYLVGAHGWFWRSLPELGPLPRGLRSGPTPEVDIIVPARDEAQTIGAVIGSLVAQDYPGGFRIILIDDASSDATAALAASAAGEFPLTIVNGRPKPSGWSGKLWALSQGIERATAPVLLFADADIVHDPRHLSALVDRLDSPPVDMVSEMVRLNCTSLAERWLIPAFVYFFQMLYPFARVNDPRSTVAAAAGGTVLIRRSALDRIGGIGAIKSALIDDVTLAKRIKLGGALYLGHTRLAASIREYPRPADIWAMIARTAFTQLRHSALLLAATVLALALVWWVPIAFTVSARGCPRAWGCAAYLLSVGSFVPTLRRYRVSSWTALALPLTALFYMAATVSSALCFWFGRGARWKNRDYQALS